MIYTTETSYRAIRSDCSAARHTTRHSMIWWSAKRDLEERLDDEQRLLLERFVEASDILSSVIESEMFKNALSMGMKLMMEVKEMEC